MDNTIIFAILSLCIAAATFFVGRVSSGKADGEKLGRIDAGIDHIKEGMSDVKSEIKDVKIEQKRQSDTMADIVERLVAVEKSAKSAHKRLDMVTGQQVRD